MTKPIAREGVTITGLGVRFGLTFTLVCATCLAGEWQGVLVDSHCYESEERNVSPGEFGIDVSHDRNLEIRFCRANRRTKFFSVIDQDGRELKLDAGGNAKAGQVVQNGNSKLIFVVNVSGEEHDGSVKVDSISMVRNVSP